MSIRNAPPAVCWLLPLAALCLLPAANLLAGTSAATNSDKSTAKDVPQKVIDDFVPLNIINAECSHVRQSPFKIKRFDGTGASTQQSHDSNPNHRPQDRRFNGGVEYNEIRAGVGITYTPLKKLDLDFAGWNFGQSCDYCRGDGSKRFETQGAPYA